MIIHATVKIHIEETDKPTVPDGVVTSVVGVVIVVGVVGVSDDDESVVGDVVGVLEVGVEGSDDVVDSCVVTSVELEIIVEGVVCSVVVSGWSPSRCGANLMGAG